MRPWAALWLPMVTPAATSWRSSSQLMMPAWPSSTGSVETNTVNGIPASSSRGHASTKVDRVASSTVMPTVRSGSGRPASMAARISGTGSTV